MELKQGERYLVVANGYGEQLVFDEIVIAELQDKFAKTTNIIDGRTEWRYVTDLEADAVAHLPPLPGQMARLGMD